MSIIKQVEIFAVGKWNGVKFSVDDLKDIAIAFNKLEGNHQVPLKMGHNQEQPFTDGQPSLGWVEKVWVEGTKLMAKFIDLPEVVFSAINKKLYKNVSIELDVGVEYKGGSYPFVLSGVALLGADIPAVNTLADLTAYMSKEKSFQDDITFSKRIAFTAINNEVKKEDKIMSAELKELQAKLDASIALNEENKKTTASFAKKQAESDIEIAKFKADKEASDKKAESIKFEADKKEFETKLEDLVKSNSITPAQREQFTKDFETNKDSVTYAVDSMVIGKKDKGLDTDDKAKDKSNLEADMSPDAILLSRAKELMLKSNSLDFNACRKQVLRLDDQLARDYIDMNGGK